MSKRKTQKSSDNNQVSLKKETHGNKQIKVQKKEDTSLNNDNQILEHTIKYEKRIYDLEQLLDIAKSFCQNLDFGNLLESIVYICMAQMHVLGAEIFVRDPISNDVFNLETSKPMPGQDKISIPTNSKLAAKLLDSAATKGIIHHNTADRTKSRMKTLERSKNSVKKTIEATD